MRSAQVLVAPRWLMTIAFGSPVGAGGEDHVGAIVRARAMERRLLRRQSLDAPHVDGAKSEPGDAFARRGVDECDARLQDLDLAAAAMSRSCRIERRVDGAMREGPERHGREIDAVWQRAADRLTGLDAALDELSPHAFGQRGKLGVAHRPGALDQRRRMRVAPCGREEAVVQQAGFERAGGRIHPRPDHVLFGTEHAQARVVPRCVILREPREQRHVRVRHRLDDPRMKRTGH